MSSILDVPVLLALALFTASGDEAAVAPATAQTTPALTSPVSAHAAERIYSDDEWLRSFRRHGAAIGHRALSERIFKTGSGRHYIPVAPDKQEILGLKRDPEIVAGIVAESGRVDATRLTPMLGRPAFARDLLAAHLLGVDAAAKLLDAAAHTPVRSAAEVVPEAALAHPALFFAGTRPRSADAVARILQSEIDQALQHRPLSSAPSPRIIGNWKTATVTGR